MLRFVASENIDDWDGTDVVGVLSVKAFSVKIEFRIAFKVVFTPLMKRINFHYLYSNNRVKWHGTGRGTNRVRHFLGFTISMANRCTCVCTVYWICERWCE